MGDDILSQSPATDDGDGVHEEVRAALLSANLKHAPRIFDGLLDQFSLGDGQRQRFLAIDVCSVLQRMEGNRNVPVVRRSDRDDVRFLFFE